jgi:hypothetical protein
MILSNLAIEELKNILLQKEIVMTDEDLQKFGSFLITITEERIKMDD